jgi:hypothetical protein
VSSARKSSGMWSEHGGVVNGQRPD